MKPDDLLTHRHSDEGEDQEGLYTPLLTRDEVPLRDEPPEDEEEEDVEEEAEEDLDDEDEYEEDEYDDPFEQVPNTEEDETDQ